MTDNSLLLLVLLSTDYVSYPNISPKNSSFAWLFNYDYLVCFGKNVSTIMLWSSNDNALEVGLILGSLIQDKAPTCIKVSLKKILSCGETKGQHMSSTLRQSVANSFSPKGQEQ
jgi:hypothetical protein